MSDDRYQNKTYIGSGGMATVYRAWDSLVGRDVALKEIAEELRGNEDVREMFLNEARKMARVKHLNVVQVYDVLYNDGIPTIVQEFMDGGSLGAKIGASTMSPDEVLKMLNDVIYGLRAIHAAGLIHRDMKPDNVLGDKGDWKVGDFGVAMSGDEEVLPFVGSKYAAPEVLNAPDTISVRSDIYSVGVMAMELLLGSERFEASAREAMILKQGEPPGGRDTAAAFWQRWVSGSASLPPLNQIEPTISEGLAEFLLRLTSKDQDQRPSDCDVVLAEIARLREDESMRMGAPTAPNNKVKQKKDITEEPEKKAKSPLWFKAIIAVGLVLLLGIGALFVLPKGDKQYNIELVSQPPGASVSINGQALPDASPVVVDLKLGDVILWKMSGFTSTEVTLAKGIPGLLRNEAEQLQLTTKLIRDFYLDSSQMSQAYLSGRWNHLERVQVSWKDTSQEETNFVLPLDTPVSFDMQSNSSGVLSVLHLGSNDLLALIYPDPNNETREVIAGQKMNIGDELSLVTSEPVGRDWMVFIVSERPLNIPTIEGFGLIESWARGYEFGLMKSPAEQLLVSIMEQTENNILAVEIIEIDVVKGAGE
ncbi:MAG: serine/threonine protein kinase [Halioglobus sp.]|jgi:serine/threonine protein kinase